MIERRPVLFFGEVLWDLLPGGAEPGGAPANAAVQASGLGAGALLVSAVGEDGHGQAMMACLKAQGISTEGISVCEELPTGTVKVTLSKEGNASYEIVENVAWDRIILTDAALAAAGNAGACYFGSLAQRSAVSRKSLEELLALVPQDCVRFCDVNLREPLPSKEVLKASLACADVLKLNNEELPVLAGMLRLPKEERGFVEAVQKKFGVKIVVVTKGKNGASTYDAGMNCFNVKSGGAVKVVDTVGAGDAFSAGFLNALTLGKSVLEATDAGAVTAEKTLSHAGAWPVLKGGKRG